MKKSIRQTDIGCIVPIAIVAISIVLGAFFHIGFLSGIAVAVIALLVISSFESKQEKALLKRAFDETFQGSPNELPKVIEHSIQGERYIGLHYSSKAQAHASVRAGAVTAYAKRVNELCSPNLGAIETRYPGWDEERWMHLPPDNPPIELDFGDDDTKGDLDQNPLLRLAKVLSLFVIVGIGVVFSLLQDASLSAKLIILGIIIAIAVIAWAYLEFRDLIIQRKETTGLLRWKLASIAIHPAMIPVYTIAFPIIGILIHAWLRHSQI